LWIEQVRLDLHTPLDRTQAAQRQDAVGELIRLADRIGADPSALRTLVDSELGALLKALPPEVAVDAIPQLTEPGELLGLLRDAEATVLARLAATGDVTG
jgi:hypothetical protein